MSAMRRQLMMKIATQCLMVTAYVGALGACTDVYAADTSTVRGSEFAQRTVSYADLDLTRSAGAEALYTRIRSAAKQVCAPSFPTWEWEATKTTRPCIDQAIARAVADVHAPMLTSYYMAKSQQTIRLAGRK
jgi:UrcA family protein